LGRLAGKIAHDFNNILTTIVGFSDLLIEDLQGHSSLPDVQEIKRAGERGSALTASILSFSRRERPTLASLSVNEAVSGISGMLNQLLPKNVDLEMDLAEDLPPALADLGQVEQALVNLVVNARDALPEGGKIQVTTGRRRIFSESPHSSPLPRPGDYVTVTVRDNGAGIEPATVERIFEPFFTTKPRGAGTGLGLSTVISIVRGCGGGVQVESSPGAGSALHLFFPVCHASSNGAKEGEPQTPEHVAASGLDVVGMHEDLTPSLCAVPVAQGKGLVESEEPVSAEHLQHLLHVVSHDLHEPLRMVNSYLGLLKRRAAGALSGDLGDLIDEAVDGGHRMQAMLDGLLRYSRLSRSAPSRQPCSTAEVYEKVLRGLTGHEAIHWKGVQPLLPVAPEHLAILLRELLSNALKFADSQNPRVEISCDAEADSWRISVTDNGAGLPEGPMEKCFQLFGRLHGREEFPGLGVGLALAHVIADIYEVPLTIDNNRGAGTRVSMLWPAVQEARV
jgi:signal transduction histidine kinase